MKVVPSQDIRKLFADGLYEEELGKGELTAKLKRDSHPSPPKAFLPTCTRSQVIVYLDHSSRMAAIVHQYLLPDGTLGASGKPDPKALRHATFSTERCEQPPVENGEATNRDSVAVRADCVSVSVSNT